MIEGSFNILRCGHFDNIRINFQKCNIGWPQQPQTEKLQKFKKKIFHDSTKNNGFQIIKIKLNSTTWMTLECSVVIFQALECIWPQ